MLYSREWAPDTYRTGGWVDLRAGLDTEARGKIFAPARDKTLVDQSLVRRYMFELSQLLEYFR